VTRDEQERRRTLKRELRDLDRQAEEVVRMGKGWQRPGGRQRHPLNREASRARSQTEGAYTTWRERREGIIRTLKGLTV
jgi:predicted phage gp36 major capsid-like protein